MARDGLVAGLLGALVVAVSHGVADLVSGDPLRTPTILGALLFGGLEDAQNATADLGLALRFTGTHVLVWAVLGSAGSVLISIVDSRPRLASIVFGGFAFVFISVSYLSGAFSVPGLGPMHLWIGTLLGSAAAAGYLSWRHPQLRSHIERVHLTKTTRSEIERALALEASGLAAFESSATAFPDSALPGVLQEKRSRVDALSKLVSELGLQAPASPAPAFEAASAGEAVRCAIEHERELVDLYDSFLAVVPEMHIREIFLRLRYDAEDGTIRGHEGAPDT